MQIMVCWIDTNPGCRFAGFLKPEFDRFPTNRRLEVFLKPTLVVFAKPRNDGFVPKSSEKFDAQSSKLAPFSMG